MVLIVGWVSKKKKKIGWGWVFGGGFAIVFPLVLASSGNDGFSIGDWVFRANLW
jgi:hypothetical protein